jgi:hypothetical protein
MEVGEAVRITVLIYRHNTNYESAWDHTEEIIKLAIGTLHEENFILHKPIAEKDVCFLKLQMFDSGVTILFDIFYTEFNVKTAHLYGQELPVIVVVMKRRGLCVFEANDKQQSKANWEIRKSFNQSGTGSIPPFRIDFRNSNSYSHTESAYRDRDEFRAQERVAPQIMLLARKTRRVQRPTNPDL